MGTPTSTIRVSRATHEALAAQARERGISMAALLAEIAEEKRRQSDFRSEREASRRDRLDTDAQAEQIDWATADEDGLG